MEELFPGVLSRVCVWGGGGGWVVSVHGTWNVFDLISVM